MARIELTQSGVLFNEELHEYWLDGKQLSGITCLFLKKVDSISTLKINTSISVRNQLTLLTA